MWGEIGESDMTFETAIVQRLKLIKKQMNITKEDLAKRSGISVVTINDILNQKTKTLNPQTLSHLIKALNMSYTEFFNDSMFDWGNLVEEI